MVYLKDKFVLICNLGLLIFTLITCTILFVLSFLYSNILSLFIAIFFLICSIAFVIILLKYTTRKIEIKDDIIVEKNVFGKITNRVKNIDIKKICIESYIKEGKYIVLRDDRQVQKQCKTSYGEEISHRTKFINFKYTPERLDTIKSFVNCDVQEYGVE